MNRPLLGSSAMFFLAFYAMGLLGFAAYSYVGFPGSVLLSSLRWEYTVERGLSLFVYYLIPLQAVAIAVFSSSRAPGAPFRFNETARTLIVILLVLTALYTVLYEEALPNLDGRLAAMQRGSSLTRQDPGRARKEKRSGQEMTPSVDSRGKNPDAFFLDDAKRAEPLPGVQSILFINDRSGGATEAVFVGKMVEMPPTDTYFFDIEAIRYDEAGAVAWHFKAPYGRRLGDSILMRCVDRETAGAEVLPLYLVGWRQPAVRAVLPLRPNVEELRVLSTEGDPLATTGTVALWRMQGTLGSFGTSRQDLTMEMALRFLMPFVFLVFSLFAFSLGWAFRARLGLALTARVLLTPLVMFASGALALTYVYAHHVILGFTVLTFGLPAALVVLAILQAALLTSACVAMTAQLRRSDANS